MSERKFRTGDRVRFQRGLRHVEGQVREDLGPLGIKGRHLYRVEFPVCRDGETWTTSEIELPAVDMELVQGAASTR